MIATLIIIFALFRDFRWPRKRTESSSPVADKPSSAEQLPTNIHSATTTSTTTSGKMPNSSEDENEDNSSGPAESSRRQVAGTEKRSSEASSISTSVSTEQTQIDATLGSTSSGTLPSASSPLTPSSGGGCVSAVGHMLVSQHQAQHFMQRHLSLSSEQTRASSTLNNSSTSTATNTTTTTNNNLLGNRHEHRLLSNSSTDTISALHNLSSHSEGYTAHPSVSTTTGSGHSSDRVITYPFKIRGDSTASTISTSACSEVLLPPDGRRSSEGARLMGHRRSSGRIRRYVPRTTTISSGGRRRTTGRYRDVLLLFVGEGMWC